ncbi:MAG: acyltransferase [Pseudomonadota bacterium]|nr:acyltransferase [Pseudomonadota bacterium]
MIERREDLVTIQALRAVAALMVVAYHAAGQWGGHLASLDEEGVWPNGSAGVDIFFVISGLVMAISASRIASRPQAWRIFFSRRLARIVPMYRVTTTVKILAVLALPAFVARTRLDPMYVLGSYLFVPVRDAAGVSAPVLPVGWTLSFEMTFYVLVAAALFLRLSLFRVAAPVLLALAILAIVRRPNWPAVAALANVIVLEFLFGAVIGARLLRGTVLPTLAAGALLPLAFAVIVAIPVGSGTLRIVTWGVPAAAIVAAAVALEHRLGPALPPWLLRLGDASYSIYLTHGFVVPVVVLLVVHAHLPKLAALLAIIIGCIVASAIVGLLAYAGVEHPLLRYHRRKSLQKAFVATQ